MRPRCPKCPIHLKFSHYWSNKSSFWKKRVLTYISKKVGRGHLIFGLQPIVWPNVYAASQTSTPNWNLGRNRSHGTLDCVHRIVEVENISIPRHKYDEKKTKWLHFKENSCKAQWQFLMVLWNTYLPLVTSMLTKIILFFIKIEICTNISLLVPST